MRRTLLICLSLIAVTLVVFWPVRQQQFVNLDDDIYVTDNPHVATGLNLENVRWAFTATRGTHWFPLTWLSHMLDCELFGLNAGAHKLVNVAIHIASVLLLFLLLQRTTGKPWPSAFVAMMFAIHPLRVESVAWVAERKDVLSVFFWMLTLWSYVRYVERPGIARYLWILSFFILGLKAKPMIVTLPFVLLLLDFWPLRRRVAIREKLPLFAVSAGWSVITYLVTHDAGATMSTGGLRFSNAVISYVRYLGKMFWPVDLAVFYPLPAAWPVSQVAAAAMLLIGLTIVAVRLAKGRPYYLVGWLWYLGTLVPVIGLVQIGLQSMADRFTYIPSIGIFLGLAFGAAEVKRTRWVAVAGAAMVAGCAVITSIQLRHWNDSVSLYRHALAVTGENFLVEANLGVVLCNQGQFEEGIAHLREALRLSPRYGYAHNHLGRAYFAKGQTSIALAHLRRAVELSPRDPASHNNLGGVYAKLGRLEEAAAEFTVAIRLQPDYARAHANLGGVLLSLGRSAEAAEHLREALRLQPDLPEALYHLEEIRARS